MKARLFLILFVWIGPVAAAEKLRIAVASNFNTVMPKLVDRFESQFDVDVVVSYGSTGKLYAQILHGAPFDLFFSADQQAPLKLVHSGIGVGASVITYAEGLLYLYFPKCPSRTIESCLVVNGKIAMANPKLAPYGRAAMQANAKAQFNRYSLIQGENISQVWQFAYTQSVDVAYVAGSQVIKAGYIGQPGVFKVDENHYDAIKQDVVLLSRAKNATLANHFLSFVATSEAKKMIREAGYRVSEGVE